MTSISRLGVAQVSIVKDTFTRWPEAFLIPDIYALTIARALVAGWISCFCVLSTVTTDRGSQFESSLFAKLTHLIMYC
uniref:Integrase catalytic domain-containing protein n=1 Tax=Amphimedon queenslandica TaxID=400682 RepID=A0A1X7UX97_AMPQE